MTATEQPGTKDSDDLLTTKSNLHGSGNERDKCGVSQDIKIAKFSWFSQRDQGREKKSEHNSAARQHRGTVGPER